MGFKPRQKKDERGRIWGAMEGRDPYTGEKGMWVIGVAAAVSEPNRQLLREVAEGKHGKPLNMSLERAREIARVQGLWGT